MEQRMGNLETTVYSLFDGQQALAKQVHSLSGGQQALADQLNEILSKIDQLSSQPRKEGDTFSAGVSRRRREGDTSSAKGSHSRTTSTNSNSLSAYTVKPMRLDFPRFKGEEDLISWLAVLDESDEDVEVEVENQDSPSIPAISNHALAEYKKGKENIVADALSRKYEEDSERSLLAISQPIPSWLETIKTEHATSPNIQSIIHLVQKGEVVGPWAFQEGVLYFKNQIYLDEDSPSLQRDCWIIRAASADGCSGSYVVAASAGNTFESGIFLPKMFKLSMLKAGLYYEEALAALNVVPLKDHFDKGWISHVQLKAALFYAEACYRYSLELHEKEEIAEEIARLKSGISALTEAKKSSRGAAAQLLDAMTKLQVNLNRNLERAMKENDRVYLMRVPSPSSLPPLPAFSMVKPMSINEVLDTSKEKMFASLVPDSSAKALSRYTEMVDDVIRTQAERLQQGSELTRVRLKEMDLPDSILALEGNMTLPTDLKEDVEAVQISGGPAGLEAELQQLRDLRRVNQELLVQTEELLQKEATEDAQFGSHFGTRWTRPQSSTPMKNLQDRLNRFAGNLKQAAESDARIERSVRDNAALMSILDRRPIESALPTLAKPIMSLDATEDAIVGGLKQSSDDILPKLMTITGSYEDLFRKEISKYDRICEDIAHNIEAQEQLLYQIQVTSCFYHVNGILISIFNLEDYRASREKCYKQIQAAIAKNREIKENINEGLKFYVTLQDAITNVKQQCSDFVMTRNIQCREMIDDVQRHMAGLSFQDRKTSVSYDGGYPSVGPPPHQTPRSTALPQTEPPNTPPMPHPQSPYYRPPEQPTMAGYGHPPPPYGTQQQSHPYHAPPAPAAPYPPQHPQQQPLPSHEYGQPAYPGWRGPYYNAHGQQPGSQSRPPYTIPSPYTYPNQGGYYKQ
ncbi:vacuolar-sorting protein BRO1-like [Pistacia vera]|uniref:vacuolar-sorting protein BRO1-like n=1 Tax=Pistacia vera TaxID=55513 RepID=UPI001263938A|nr:vacuolar-sorting protein BRO1-like [Pistacia vera]